MKSFIEFWVSAIIKILFVLSGAAIVGLFGGVTAALITMLFGLLILFFIQLFYLYKLQCWLEAPVRTRLPDGVGLWVGVFSRLYKLRRGIEKNRFELSEWLTRFRQAMHSLPDGVVIMGSGLVLEWCNPVAEQHLGFNLKKDNNMRVTNVVRSPDFFDYIIGQKYDVPLHLSFRDRKLIVRIIPFENNRQILVTHDATESDRIEKMRRDFIANASHELRTPLTVMNGFLEIAEHQPDLDQATRMEHVQLMAEQGMRMQNLVEDMLTLSRLESLDVTLPTDHVHMRDLLDKIYAEAMALSATRHTISLEVSAPDIIGNAEELRSAFSNLVSNAVRYTQVGGSIKIVWQMAKEGPQFLVQDTGIGIAPEHIGRLTERFYRVDKNKSRETQGTGLGLAIVKHILLRHRANLVIESVLGRGSTFMVKFPSSAVYQDSVVS